MFPADWTPQDYLNLGVGFLSFLALVGILFAIGRALPKLWTDVKSIIESQNRVSADAVSAMQAMTRTNEEVAKVLGQITTELKVLQISDRLHVIEVALGDLKQRQLLSDQNIQQQISVVEKTVQDIIGLLGDRRRP